MRKIPGSQAVTEWRARCPLRRWLNRKDKAKRGDPALTKMQRLQALCGGMTRAGIYAWMYGQALPPPTKIQAMMPLTGISFNQWMKWWNDCPAGDSCASASTPTAGSTNVPTVG